MISLIFRILYTATTFVQALLVFRVVFKIINANSVNSFVSWVYSISDTLIQPFQGIVADTITIDRFTIELTPLIALLFFSIIGFVFSELARAFSKAE